MGERLRAVGRKVLVGRCVILFLLIPPFTIAFAFALQRIMVTLQGHDKSGESFMQALLGLLVISFLFSWPGYLTFFILGLPTLYLLFRLSWTSASVFIIIGAVYATLPWLFLGLPHPCDRGVYVQHISVEIPFFAVAGAISGALMWFLLFRYKMPSKQVDKTQNAL